MSTTELPVDVDVLRDEIQKTYTEVSTQPGQDFIFPTAVCLGLVTVGLVLESPILLGALSVVGLAAGFTARHPFDYLWNHGVRHLLGAPPVPPNPPRRRHAFKVATAWLLVVAALFAAGLSTAALALGAMLLAACAAVTVFNLCIPSMVLSLLERRRPPEATPA